MLPHDVSSVYVVCNLKVSLRAKALSTLRFCLLISSPHTPFFKRSLKYLQFPCQDVPNILENRRRVMKKNVAILADSLPLSTSRHNTMFLKNWQHLLYVYFSCVSEPKQCKQHHNQNQNRGRF